MRQKKIIDIIIPALGAVFISVCSWVSIPITVPFTLQTFAVFCVLLLFGAKSGILSIITYIAVGAIGAPVFSNFTSGIGVIFGATGGYILGFILIGIIYWLFTSLIKNSTLFRIISLIIGLFFFYSFGTLWFYAVYTKSNGPIGLVSVLMWCVVPFILPDLLKLTVAVFIFKRLAPIIKKYMKRDCNV